MPIRLEERKNENDKTIFVAFGEDSDFKCSLCQNKIDEGYQCENRASLILCNKCQKKFDMTKCKHDKEGMHRHTKWRKMKEQKEE